MARDADVRYEAIRDLWFDLDHSPIIVYRRGYVEDVQSGSDIDEQSVQRKVSAWTHPVHVPPFGGCKHAIEAQLGQTIPDTYLLPKPKTNLVGSGAVLKSSFPSRMKRSGRNTSGSL